MRDPEINIKKKGKIKRSSTGDDWGRVVRNVCEGLEN